MAISETHAEGVQHLIDEVSWGSESPLLKPPLLLLIQTYFCYLSLKNCFSDTFCLRALTAGEGGFLRLKSQIRWNQERCCSDRTARGKKVKTQRVEVEVKGLHERMPAVQICKCLWRAVQSLIIITAFYRAQLQI